MAIYDAIPAYFHNLDELVHLAGSENYAKAIELRQKLNKDVSEEIRARTNFEALKKISKVLWITYDRDLTRLKKDIAKMALLDLNDLKGMDMVQRFVYSLWEVCFNEFRGSKEELLRSLENMWGFDSM